MVPSSRAHTPLGSGSAGSVPGLVLVVPSVEVVVEEHDTPGRHAGYDAP